MDEQSWSWITRAKEGDKEAFSLLVKEYQSLLKANVSYYVNKPYVQDAAQEIWILVYQKLWQLEDPQKFVPWLRKLVYYQCVNYRKTLRRHKRHELQVSSESWSKLMDGLSGDQLPVLEWIERQELRREVSYALDQLPGDYGLALRLRYFQELSYEEMSDLTRLPLSTVRWRIHQGKKLLKAKLLTNFKKKGKNIYV